MYRAQISTSPDFIGAVTSSETATTLSVSSAGLAANVSYYFRVSASPFSVYSGVFSTSTLANLPALNTPNWAVSDIGVTAATAVWTANNNPNGTRYRVQFATSASFVGAVSSSQTYTLSVGSWTLSVGSTVTFRVQSINLSGRRSDFVLSESTATLANIPTLNSVHWSVNDVGIAVSTARWNSNGNPNMLYRVEFATSPDFGGAVTSSETYVLSASTAGLIGNTTIAFRVQAKNPQGRATAFASSVDTATLADMATFSDFTASDIGGSSHAMRWSNVNTP